MAAPSLVISVSPATVYPGDSFKVTYSATDPDEGRTLDGTSKGKDGQPYDFHRVYHDSLTFVTPTASGVSFTSSGDGVYTGKAPSTLGGFTVKGSVVDVTGQTGEAAATVTVVAKPTPTPTPPPSTGGLKGLLGFSSEDWDKQSGYVLKTGGKFEVARRFDGGDGLKGLQNAIGKAPSNLHLASETKPGDWGSAADGAKDDDWKKQGEYLAKIQKDRGKTVWHTLHHEPGSQSLDNNLKGEGGSAEEFSAMMLRFSKIIHSYGVKTWVCMNGWQFSPNGKHGNSDAEWDKWLSPELRKNLDAIGADHYQIGKGSGDPSDNILHHLDYCKKWGIPGAIGEFNAADADVLTHLGKVLHDHKDEFAFVCLWASRGNSFDATGARVEAAQAIVKGW